jgi:hypothetical protein
LRFSRRKGRCREDREEVEPFTRLVVRNAGADPAAKGGVVEDEKTTSSEDKDKEVDAHLAHKPPFEKPPFEATSEEPEVEGHSLLDKPGYEKPGYE